MMRILYPKKCIICGRIIETDTFCEECEKIYGNRFGYKMGDEFLDKCVFALYYREPVKGKVWIYKFRSRRHLARPFAALLARTYREYYSSAQFDLIVSVPVTKKSLIKRGYNHSALMAKYLSKELKIPFSDKILRKERETTQHLKTSNERRNNIKGAFKKNERANVSKKRILLVDDIVTTGFTMKECARVLKRAGASYVSGLVLCSNDTKPLEFYR